jgi:hypothetical protein
MNHRAVDIVSVALDQLGSEPVTNIDLWKWVEHNISLATSGAIYGPMNPYRDPEIEQGLRYVPVYS